jgi:hypothetical protein
LLATPENPAELESEPTSVEEMATSEPERTDADDLGDFARHLLGGSRKREHDELIRLLHGTGDAS